jgi:flavodoxin
MIYLNLILLRRKMKSLVAYYSESDNTAKLAKVMASSLGIEARRIEAIKPEETGSYDLILIGTPVHGYKPNQIVVNFINAMPQLTGKRVAVFCTMHMSGDKKVFKILKQLLESKGLTFLGGYSSRGLSRLIANFGPRIFNKGKPSPEDLARAGEFAQNLLIK